VIHWLADDLRAEFPEMRGFSGRNLQYMASAARAWPEPIAQQPAAQLPWGHIMVLLDRLDDQTERDWYAAAAAEHGWTRNVLLNQIKNRLHQREGAAPSNFPARLPQPDSELAQQLTRDPYVFDFLGITAATTERDLEQGLIDSLQRTLSEFGRGFSFVGARSTSTSMARTSTSTCCSSTPSNCGTSSSSSRSGRSNPSTPASWVSTCRWSRTNCDAPIGTGRPSASCSVRNATTASCGTPLPAQLTRLPSRTTPSPRERRSSRDRYRRPPSSPTSWTPFCSLTA